jgi:uncharacterized protein (UPF0335 family)
MSSVAEQVSSLEDELRAAESEISRLENELECEKDDVKDLQEQLDEATANAFDVDSVAAKAHDFMRSKGFLRSPELDVPFGSTPTVWRTELFEALS